MRQEHSSTERGLGIPLLRLNNPMLLPALVSELLGDPELIVDVLDDRTIEVGVLGSYSPDAERMQTWLRVRAWEEAQRARGVDIRIELE